MHLFDFFGFTEHELLHKVLSLIVTQHVFVSLSADVFHQIFGVAVELFVEAECTAYIFFMSKLGVSFR